MKLPHASAPWRCLAIAALCLLTSCASWTRRGSASTPRSEAVCDQAPPTPVPPQPRTEPEHAAWVRILMALYEFEVDKYNIAQPCRERVRAENAKSASAD